MKLGTKILKVLLVLFVFSGQVMAAKGASSCDMEMHDMSTMDHGNMNMSHADMENQKMDCCDDKCVMDCGLSITSAVLESTHFDIATTPSDVFTILHDVNTIRTTPGLYRPPILS